MTTTRAAAVLAAAGLLMAGCSRGDNVAPTVAIEHVAHPVVALAQAATILDAIDTTLVRDRGATSSSDLGPRLLGPYAEIALAQARVDKKRKRSPAEPADFELVKLLVPSQAEWPRFFIAVGQEKGLSTPSLRVLRSADARSPYGLWADASMLPGATLPQLAAPDTGAAVVAPDATGLVASPQAVVNAYAGYLNQLGSGSKLFQRSSYSDQVVQRLKADRKALKAVAAVTSTHKPAGAPLALRTTDGGALVIAELTQTYTLKTKGNRSVQLTDKDLAALAGGKKQFGKSFTRTSVEVVVFAVPPTGGGQVTVVAAQKGDVKAVAR
jgi:hypothetical protein